MDKVHHLAGTGEDHLALVLAVGNVGIWELNTATESAWRNPRHDQIFGYPEPLEEWNYDMFLEHVVPEDREEVDAKYGEALKEGRDWSFECRINRADGAERWIAAHGKPLFREDGTIYALIGHVIDITDSKRNEEHLLLLTNELNHRVRNMLAMTKAMVNLSAAHAESVPDLAKAVQGRIAALARAHDLLFQEGRGSIAIKSVIETELRAFAGLDSGITLSGDTNTVLASEHAERFALMLHELITNAIKHGALSDDSGRLAITVERKGAEVQILWVETDGPPVAQPDKPGFGSTLLRKVAGRDGHVEMSFPREGARCTIRLPAKQGAEKPETADRPEEDWSQSEGKSPSISDLSVMVVEDEPLIALNLEDILAQAGARIFGSFASCATALGAIDKADSMPDVAILDINLSGETSADVASRLEAEGVPFIFTTGYGQEHELFEQFPNRPSVRKPTQTSELLDALKSVI